MNNNENIKDQKIKEKVVPDERLVESADYYYKAAQILFDTELDEVVMPQLCCMAIALELYFKSLSTFQVYSCDPRTSVATVWTEPSTRTHEYTKLFAQIDDDTQNEMMIKYKENQLSDKWPDFCKLLEKHNQLWIESRYIFENKIESYNFQDLFDMLKFMKQFCYSMNPKRLPIRE